MFSKTKMFLAVAAAAAAMMPTASQAQAQKPTRAELIKQVQAMKAGKADMKSNGGALLKTNLMKHANRQMLLGQRQQSPFAMAQQQFMAKQANTAARRARAEFAPVNMLADVVYDANEVYNEQWVEISMPGGSMTSLAEMSVPFFHSAWINDQIKTIYVDDSYAFYGLYFFDLLTVDPETFEVLDDIYLDDGGFGYYALALTAAPDGQNIFTYGYNTEGDGFAFSLVNAEDGAKTEIAATDNYYGAMATGKDGMIYALADDNCLWKIDPTTGAETKVGDTGLTYADASTYLGHSAAMDQKNGVLYMSAIGVDRVTSGLYAVDINTGAATLALDWGLKQVFGLTIPSAKAADDAPSAVEDLAVAFEGPALSGQVSFTAPTTTFAGDVLAGNISYSLEVDGEEVKNAAVAPGEQVVADLTLTQGSHSIVVIISNEAGNSPKAKTTVYVGYDTPMAPANVTLAIEDGVANVSWTAPAAGLHNGFLGELTYNVYRAAGSEAAVAVAEGLTECAYTETLEVGALANYVYSVEAVNADMVSAKAASNGVVVGNAMECPVEMTMTEAEFSMMTVINNNGDNRTWAFNSEGLVRYTYNSSSAADDYLITPNIKLKAGRTYVLDAKLCSYSSYYFEAAEITIGQGATAEAQTTVLMEKKTLPSGSDNVEHVEFTVPETGEYNIAFHALSDADMYYLEFRGFSLVAGPLPEAPQAVADLAATPGEQGALEATISFTAPSLRLNGEALESLTQIVVKRDGQDVKVFEAPAPGEALSFVDTDLINGTHKWVVTAFNEAENGPSVATEAFVGQDVPAAPEAYLTDLGTQVRIDWEACTVGANGGYVDPSDLTYEIYEITPDGYVGDLVVATTETTYTVDFNTNEGEADLLQYAMRTVSSVAQSSYIGTAGLLIGAPVGLPWVEEFANGSIENFMWLQMDIDNPLSQIGLSMDEGGVASFAANDAGQSGSLNTNKICLAGAQNPEVILNYTAWVGFKLEVIVTSANESEVIATVENEGDEEMHPLAAVIPAKFVSEPWVYIQLKATSATNGSLYVEDVMVRDVLEYNLSLSLEAPAKVTKGETIFVVATVTNEGAYDVDGIKVNLTAGEETFELTSDIKLGSFETVELIQEVETSIFDENETLELEAEVVYDMDLKPEDNVASASVELVASKNEGVHDLAATTNEDGTVTLSWTVSEASASEVVEDFEECEVGIYTDGMTCGEWAAVDGDKGETYGWNSTSINWSYMGAQYAYAVVNTTDMGLNVANEFGQCLMFMSVTNESGNGILADKWLISPALPGVAQTITFTAQPMTAQYGPEILEVMVSTTDADPASFTKVAEFAIDEVEPLQYSAELPEGTVYFALHYASFDIFCLFVDDITYTAGGSAPVAFEVYCDGELIGTTEECSYTVTLDQASRARAASVAGHTFSVVAVYANGAKSAPESVVADDIVGIEQLNAENAEAKAYNVSGVRVNAAEVKSGVLVIDGKKVVK